MNDFLYDPGTYDDEIPSAIPPHGAITETEGDVVNTVP